MANREERAVLRQLSTLFNIGVIRDLTDGQLVERFANDRGEAAELAFNVLIERHGSMVLRVCRAVLRDHHEAQDAFQATFLVLVKKSRALWVRDSLGPWLHQVAYRTASCARAAADRRRNHELRAAEMAATIGRGDDGIGSEFSQALHEEIERLPERYRVPIVLCDLEGQTCEQAARRTGRPVGTIKSWRARGREQLRDRLIRRGLGSAPALPMVLLPAEGATAGVPVALAEAAARAAMSYAAGRAATVGTASASVVALAEGITRTMIMARFKLTAATLLAIAATSAVVPLFLNASDGRADGPARAASAPDRPEDSLRQEIVAAVRSAKANPHEDLVNGQFRGGVETLLILARAQEKMGDRDAAKETRRGAAQVAEREPPGARFGVRRHKLLAQVAWAQTKADDGEAARETLRKAIEATKDQRWISDTLVSIAAVQAELGDLNAARGTLQALRDATVNDEPPGGPREPWLNLIRATAWTGDYEGATALTVEASRKLKDSGIRDDGLFDLAMVACNRGDFEDALKATEAIVRLQGKQAALRHLALFQVRAGDIKGARAWIDRLDSPPLKAIALDGLATGLATKAGTGWEEVWAMEP